MLLQRIVDEMKWQIEKLQEVIEHLTAAQKAVDELGADIPLLSEGRNNRGNSSEGGSDIPLKKKSVKTERKQKTKQVCRKTLTPAEKLEKKREYQRLWCRKKAAEKRAAKAEIEEVRPAKKQKINLPMSKEERKKLLKSTYRKRMVSRTGVSEDCENSDNFNLSDIGIVTGGSVDD